MERNHPIHIHTYYSSELQQLCRNLGDRYEQNKFSHGAKGAADFVTVYSAEINGLVLRLNEYTVSKEKLQRNLLEQELIAKVTIACRREQKRSQFVTK